MVNEELVVNPPFFAVEIKMLEDLSKSVAK